uniref:Mitochondrial inner membrane protease ATP23 n=1 Tax=Lygus hesperus TaxID=30085 RepID=A0A0A9YH71_LYGHE
MEIGADIPPPQELVQCILCDIPANAILLRNGDEVAIAVCQNHVRNQILLNDTLTHELIHLYDYARAYLDTNDPKQLACTEVRASALSGECCRIRERNRGTYFLLRLHPPAPPSFWSAIYLFIILFHYSAFIPFLLSFPLPLAHNVRTCVH